MSTAEIAALDIGKLNNMTVGELQTLVGRLAGTSYNRFQKFAAAEARGKGISSLAKGKLEQYMRGRSYLNKDGKLTFSVPTKGYQKREGDQKYGRLLRSQSLKNTLISDAKAYYNFLISSGSTVTGARKIARDTAEKLGFEGEPSDDVLRDIWNSYDEYRAEIEAISEGSPIFQKFITSLYQEGISKEDIKSTLYDLLKKKGSTRRFSASNTDEENKEILKQIFIELTNNKYADKQIVDDIANRWFDKGVKV